MEALLTDTHVSGQLHLQPPSQNPIFDNSDTNSVFLHSVSGQLQLQTVILLQIVMASHGTHLVKNHESLSITRESQFIRTKSPKLKMLGAFV